MAQKPGLPKREPLTAAIISYLKPGRSAPTPSAPACGCAVWLRVLPVLGHRPAVQITRRELQEQVMRPRLAKAPRVATQMLSRIRCAYAHAIEHGRLPDEFNCQSFPFGAFQLMFTVKEVIS